MGVTVVGRRVWVVCMLKGGGLDDVARCRKRICFAEDGIRCQIWILSVEESTLQMSEEWRDEFVEVNRFPRSGGR